MPICENNTISQVLFITIFMAHFQLRMLIPMIKSCNLVRPFPLLSILLLILSTPSFRNLTSICTCILCFLHLVLITKTLLITENEIILRRRGAHLGRLIMCSSVKLYIMTKKNRYSIDIILRTAQLKKWRSCLVTIDHSSKVFHTQHQRMQNR